MGGASSIGGYGRLGIGAAAAPPHRAGGSPGRDAAAPDASGPTDTVNLSPAAERLTLARRNLAVRESSPDTCTVAEWMRLQGDATVTTERRPAADQQIAALETTDPEHAQMARQARAFAIDSANGGQRYQNPFAGLDRIGLTAIVADEAGLYTNDERDAAGREMNRQTHAWQDPHMLATGGARSSYFTEAARQYAYLSPLERSGYPADYVAQCQRAADEVRRDEKIDPFWWMDSNAPDEVSPADVVERALLGPRDDGPVADDGA